MISCEHGTFVIQEKRNYDNLVLFTIPEEHFVDSQDQPFKFFPSKFDSNEFNVLFGYKVLLIRVNYDSTFQVDIRKTIDLSYLKRTHPQEMLRSARDLQIIDEENELGFIYLKKHVSTFDPGTAHFEFFVRSRGHRRVINSHTQ